MLKGSQNMSPGYNAHEVTHLKNHKKGLINEFKVFEKR